MDRLKCGAASKIGGCGTMDSISVLLGKTLVSIDQCGIESINFKCTDGTEYIMYPLDYYESASIKNVIGEYDNLIGSPILMAEEIASGDSEDCNWTFYKLATVKGYVTIRWYGSYYGYYSGGINFTEVKGSK